MESGALEIPYYKLCYFRLRKWETSFGEKSTHKCVNLKEQFRSLLDPALKAAQAHQKLPIPVGLMAKHPYFALQKMQIFYMKSTYGYFENIFTSFGEKSTHKCVNFKEEFRSLLNPALKAAQAHQKLPIPVGLMAKHPFFALQKIQIFYTKSTGGYFEDISTRNRHTNVLTSNSNFALYLILL